ncbi:MAG TPA: biopolymer transporter ExbD [Candidatus Binataceae bacterium]|jgi:biopolymer transport protein ExbD|nr:biopolymer transporter ExbD [Candidatus Binataceae bacterium]
MAVSGPSSGGGGGVFWQINITPLTDIFLVLLIIFMITASISVESAAHVGLPLAENTSPEKRGVVVTYTVDHEIFVNSKDIPSSELEGVLREALARIDPKIVIFQGDRKVVLGDLVKILRVAKAAGADQIAIAAKRASVEELQRSLRQ